MGEYCQVAGWGVTNTKTGDTPKSLLWAKVPIKNVTACRVKAFKTFLKHDIEKLTGARSKSMVTWKNVWKTLEKLGGSKTYVPPGIMETLIYRPINERMHICAGNTKTDSCQVGMLSWVFYL